MSTAHSPWRAVVTHAIFASDIAPLWQVASPFDSLPALVPELVKNGTTSGQGVGMTRTLHLTDGSSCTEELIAFHPADFLFTYAMPHPVGMPWSHYFCTVRLQALGAGQTHLSITGYFQPLPDQEPACREALSGVYQILTTAYAKTLGAAFEFQT